MKGTHERSKCKNPDREKVWIFIRINQTKKMTNKYVEYRKWVLFWGLFIDQQNEVNKMLNKYNEQDWHVVQFEWNGTKLPITRMIFVILVTLVTLGFVSYWTGFSFVLEKQKPNLLEVELEAGKLEKLV
jgi:hypothetical protein